MRTKVSIIALVAALGLAGLTSAPADPSDDPPKTARYYRQQAAAAYKAKDYALAIDNLKKALELIPDHPTLFYNIAAISALQGKKSDAIAGLTKVAAMGLALHPEKDGDFDSIKDSDEFKNVLRRFESNNAPVINSATAFTIHEKGLITEGLAYDPVSETFFVSSVHKRRILAVNKNGEAKTFAGEQAGLWSVLGMKVDAKRRLLWATTTAFPQMVNFNKDEENTSAVLKFDLKTGKLIKRYVLPNKPKGHGLGDLTIDSNGNVFTTDSLTPAVYVIHPQKDEEKDEIELFLENDGFISPQGLAFSGDERHLFMADYSTGLFDIDVRTKRVVHLPPLEGATLLGIDGLYFYGGNLIGVQNGVAPWRLVRIVLTDDFKRVERLQVIEANNPVFDEPTLGVIVRDSFYFIANSQWGLVDDKGQLGPADKLADPVVLKMKL
ncbi:MAG TPA: L-dopachrome tautomerase-related protein [Blastocatellia bacterium]|nr:L-dopachrome tautomerase-related protein [Blastocatellia bacterium]